MVIERLKQYAYLMRFHKPIGILLLLWPTLWGLWLAGPGAPSLPLLLIFIAGVFLMRSCGCIINDFADRHFDGHIKRTRERPLASGKISVAEALSLFVVLLVLAFVLVVQLNHLTILCAFVGAGLTVFYPFMKRFTHLPQLGLGLAFTLGIPMAFTARQNEIPAPAWCLFLTAVLWPISYDTLYAMADREDDLKIGLKSTAILFGGADRLWIAVLQLLFLLGLAACGLSFNLKAPFYGSLGVALLLFAYQHYLILDRCPLKCFQAFLNNHWVGLSLFLGIVWGL